MEKLKVKFRRIDETVFMKIVQQDESTRGNGELFNYDGFKILSKENPSLCLGGNLMIWGVNKSKDKYISAHKFESVYYAKSYTKKAKACIKAYNESLGEKEVEKEEGRWIPEKNDIYYFVRESVMRGLTCGRASFCNDDTDKTRLLTNNVFKTESEAERAVEIERKKMELSKVFTKEEWEMSGVEKWYISLDMRRKVVEFFCTREQIKEGAHFETKEKAKEFYDFCAANDDAGDYLKYVLGVY